MNLFFGKISKKYDTNQIDEGYYEAPKGSSWFGNIDIGDYCYIIGGDRIQFWKAKEWVSVKDNDRLYFDILNPNLGINVNDLIALTFLKLDKPLLVLSSRSARNRAFFKLQLLENYTPDELAKSEFYISQNLYRQIKIVGEGTIDNASNDIQLFLKNGSLKLVHSSFFDDAVYSLFRDNLQFLNKGAKHKDSTLNKVKSAIENNNIISKEAIGLRSFYDAFFCDYDEGVDYYLLGAYWNDNTPPDMTPIFVKEERWANGYDDKYINEVKSIKPGSHIAIKAAYVKGKTDSVMMIKARGIVTKNHSDGRNLDVKWEQNFKAFEVSFGGYMKTVKEVVNKDHIAAIWDDAIEINDFLGMENDVLKLVRYKKQIILQGPPGTGKTRLAKQLAQHLALPTSESEITMSDIASVLTANLDIATPTGYNTFKVLKHNTDSVTIYPKDAKNPYNVPYRDIIKSAKLYKQPEQDKASDAGGVKSYIIALANYIVEALIEHQIKLIQFHPSYTYEDFVRGIVAESKGDKIEYRNVNKILGQFANEANENLELSKKDNLPVQQDRWIEESFNDFKEEVETEIEQNEITLSNNVNIFKVEGDCFRYGKDWGVPSRINFVEFKKVIKAVLNQTITLNQNAIPKEISVHAHYRFTYYLALLRIFFDKYKFEVTSEKQPLKNYVLIIDEINRANLSSVLGELIYALEYRGEPVESMYAVNGHTGLILPPNLYIIGTMNTADRSVGHIDYAIRRRFAFVDVLPTELILTDGKVFHAGLFKKVSELFITNYDEYIIDNSSKLIRADTLSPEFEPKDLWLGHSYFIDEQEKGNTITIRLQYEIKPILLEYVKDGILIGDEVLQKINDLSV